MHMTSRFCLALAGIALVGRALAQAAPEPRIQVYPAGVAAPATLTLLAYDGKIGRSNPFYDNYRPQLQFSAEPERITCTLRLPPPLEKVEPGQTVTLQLNCPERFRVREDRPGFVVFEGGRRVAEGRLQ